MLQDRVEKAQRSLEKHDVDAIVFFNMSNVRYLSGFTGSDAALVIGRTAGWFLTDSRYTTQASREVTGCERNDYAGKLDGVATLLGAQGLQRVGFEANHTTVATMTNLSGKLPEVTFIPIGDELDWLRAKKDAAEIERLGRTAALASSAFQGLLERLRPGMTEREAALDLEFAMRRAGADGASFDFIVASGERGALPHGRASEKPLARGELITFDFGAVLDGYCSDETVTVACGEPDGRQREIYGIVREAHDLAIAAVRPGVSFRDVDQVARGFIEEQGYGHCFGHGLGHGVGLEVHEKPVVSPRGEGTVEAGMVFTIEPGIYIPGWGGVRIEDTVVVTDDGCRLLTQVPKELMRV